MLLVALLHVLVYWAITSSINISIDSKPSTFEWVMISPPHEAEPIRANPSDVITRSRATAPAPQPLTMPLATPDDAPHAPDKPGTDWNSELELVAKGAASGNGSTPHRDFGFPRRAPLIKTPTCEWDRVHTHRVEIGPAGGVIVHLSDKCVMVFVPFPFALCGIGKKQANGHLLDHMQDPPASMEAPAPP